MSPSHVVVDGSNIATEGRSTPSLKQLDEAIREFQAEFPGTEVIVVVDATFGHRIAASERPIFDEAVAHGELVTPPAGAIGRGDAFVLRVAERVNGQVLSNDSFQEFHADHPWLFDEGRLMGGKPVPGVGWIFTPRLPVRGPRSRAATSTTSGRGRRGRTEADGQTASGRGRRPSKVAEAAIALATEEASQTTRLVSAPTSPKVGDVIRVPETGEAIKVAKATKATKAAKAAKTAKEPAKAAKTAKVAKAAKAAKTTKAAKAAKEPVKAAKAIKATPATKAAKTTKAAKAVKATKVPAKAGQTTKAAKAPRPAKVAGEPARATKATGTKTAKETAPDGAKVPRHMPARPAIKAAKQAGTVEKAAPPVAIATGGATTAPSGSRRGRRGRATAAPAVLAAIDAATEEALGGDVGAATARPPRGRGRSQEPAAPTAVNDPLTFLTFVTEHPLGSSVLGTVSSFVSHGAMVDVDGMSCYLPLTGLGDPPPRRAREVVAQGEQRSFIVVALDPPRRGAELALPEMAQGAGTEPARVNSRRTKKAARTTR